MPAVLDIMQLKTITILYKTGDSIHSWARSQANSANHEAPALACSLCLTWIRSLGINGVPVQDG
jgi:hypothetical protein